jgi:hypothetical protein
VEVASQKIYTQCGLPKGMMRWNASQLRFGWRIFQFVLSQLMGLGDKLEKKQKFWGFIQREAQNDY